MRSQSVWNVMMESVREHPVSSKHVRWDRHAIILEIRSNRGLPLSLYLRSSPCAVSLYGT